MSLTEHNLNSMMYGLVGGVFQYYLRPIHAEEGRPRLRIINEAKSDLDVILSSGLDSGSKAAQRLIKFNDIVESLIGIDSGSLVREKGFTDVVYEYLRSYWSCYFQSIVPGNWGIMLPNKFCLLGEMDKMVARKEMDAGDKTAHLQPLIDLGDKCIELLKVDYPFPQPNPETT